MEITIRHVSKRFGDFVVLDDVSVVVPAGALTALLGPSGSGKSTLLRVIAGLEQPETGEVLIANQAVTQLPAQQRGVGLVFQHYAAFKHLTVWENVAFGLKIRKRSKPEIRERVTELLSLVQLEGFADRYPAQLSGGQRQRMVLARALAIEPKVLLLDEPFGALDAHVRQELRRWLRQLREEVRVTTILVTHDQEEAMEVADELVVLNQGRVEQVGKPQEIYEHPASEFVMGFIGPVTRLGGRFIRPHAIAIQQEPSLSSREARITRISQLGFETRIELVLDDGQQLWAQLTSQEAQQRGLEQGQVVCVSPDREQVFAPAVNGRAVDRRSH
jgi:sulfate transport system ATP-binding protein